MTRVGSMLLALAAVLLALGVWWLTGLGHRNRGTGSAAERPEIHAGIASAALEDAGQSSALRSEADASTSEESAVVAPLLGAEEEAVLRGQVVDSRGRPVEDAEVVAVHRPARVHNWLGDHDYEDLRSRAAEARSDAEGRFAITLPASKPHDLHAHAEGWAAAVAADVHAGQFVTITLHRAASVQGIVKRAADGAPVADARVIVHSEPVWEGKTDAGGHYHAEGLDAGEVDLMVIPQEEVHSLCTLELKEGERLVHDVVVKSGATASGEVRDKVTGRPIEGAEVSSWSFYAKIARTDASGRYSLAGLRDKPVVYLEARARGYGRFEQTVTCRLGEVVQADFDLVPAQSARGRVITRSGSPVAGAYVAAYANAQDRGMNRGDLVSTRSAADGRFELRDLRPDLPHALFVRKDRHPTFMASIANGGGPTIDLGDIVLPAGASLWGTVAAHDGAGLEGALVQVRCKDPAVPQDAASLEQRGATTDPEGRFRVADLLPGKHSLRVVAKGAPILEDVEVDLAEGEARRGFRVVLNEGLSIEGRVVDPYGLGVAGAQLRAEAEAGDDKRFMGSRSSYARSSDDGSFAFAGLDPGKYKLTANYPGEYGAPDNRYELAEAQVEGVPAGESHVEVQFPRAEWIEGAVLSPDGRGVAHVRVSATDGRGRRVAWDDADGEGKFRLKVAQRAAVELRAWPTKPDPRAWHGWTADESEPPIAVKSDVKAGATGVVLAVKP